MFNKLRNFCNASKCRIWLAVNLTLGKLQLCLLRDRISAMDGDIVREEDNRQGSRRSNGDVSYARVNLVLRQGCVHEAVTKL